MGGAIPLLPLYALMACTETFSFLLLYWLQKLTELYANGLRYASDLNTGHLFTRVTALSGVWEILHELLWTRRRTSEFHTRPRIYLLAE